MPDWFYRTVSRPLLFALPHNLSRRLVVSFMGTLGRAPFGLGRRCIDFLGHMTPPPGLQTRLLHGTIRGPIGASCWFDGEGSAPKAWSRFGFGLIELGPCWIGEDGNTPLYSRDNASASVRVRQADGPLAPARVKAGAAAAAEDGLSVLVRLQPRQSKQPEALAWQTHRTMEALDPSTTGFVLDLRRVDAGWTEESWARFWDEFNRMDKARSESTGQRAVPVSRMTSLLLLVPVPIDAATHPIGVTHASCPAEAESVMIPLGGTGTRVMPTPLAALVRRASQAGVHNWLLENSVIENDEILAGHAHDEAVLTALANIRREAKDGDGLWINAGAREPADVFKFLQAGADGVLVDSGLVYSGPGLVKRANDFVLAQRREALPTTRPASRTVNASWFWGAMLGLAMLIGSVLALSIAAVRVVLPYDEAFCGLSRVQIDALNPRLLSFMAHDRISLAGTMIAIGILYGGLSRWGIRRGMHWARTALLWSGGAGFFSFFLFLGFGYFDPFHGFVTAILFQIYLLCLVGQESPPGRAYEAEARETAAWRLGQWGQCLLVLHGAGLLGAGLTIAGVGVLDVFIATDLTFLQTTAEDLQAASERLIPIIAHDRATMGGMLIAAGIPFLLAALWGMGCGTRWLWWTLLWAGLPAYACAIGIHYVIGYTDPWHLLPVWLGLGLLAAGLGLARSWMMADSKWQIADRK